jgi:hypothetical protein
MHRAYFLHNSMSIYFAVARQHYSYSYFSPNALDTLQRHLVAPDLVIVTAPPHRHSILRCSGVGMKL